MKGCVADILAQKLDFQQKQLESGEVPVRKAESTTRVVSKSQLKTATKTAMSDEDNSTGEELHFDASRNLAYIIYGGMYTGIAQHFIYNEIFPQIFGHDPTTLTIISEVIANALIVGPLIGMPVAYLTKALVLHHQSSDNPISEGLKRYAEDVQLKGLLFKYWALWCPVQTLTFSVVPEHLRVAFMAAVSFFWFVILSTVSADGEEHAGGSSSGSKQGAYAFPQRP